MAKTRWGIAGAGKISHDFVTSFSATTSSEPAGADDHSPVAVAARELSRAQEFATKHGIGQAYGSYEELAADKDVEVVYVAVIAPFHLKVVKIVLEAGKHVVCEKPLGMNVAEVSEMLDLATSKKVFFMEAIWSRTFPLYQRVSEIVDSKEIGEVSNIFVSFGQKGNHLPEKRLAKKEQGGGTVLDWGVYCIQFILMIFKGERPTKVVASSQGLNENGIDLGVSCALHFSGNRIATFVTDLKIMLPNEAIVCGSEGRVKVESPFHCPTNLTLTKYPAKNVAVDTAEKFPLPSAKGLQFNCLNSEGLLLEANEVRRCLMEGLEESKLCTKQDSLIIAEIEEEINKQIGVKF